MKLRYGKGVGSVEITGELKELINKALRNANKILLEAVELELSKIEKNAIKNWPVRQKKYGKSKGSKNKFSKGFRIIPPDQIEGFIRNTAPYAFAIKASSSSSGGVKEGDRVAKTLVFDPTEEAANRIIKIVADALMDNLRK